MINPTLELIHYSKINSFFFPLQRLDPFERPWLIEALQKSEGKVKEGPVQAHAIKGHTSICFVHSQNKLLSLGHNDLIAVSSYVL